MLKTLAIATVLGLALCSCSKQDDSGMDKARSSADKAIDSAKDAATSAAEKTKESSRKAMSNLADKSKGPPSAAAEEWRDFRALVKKCEALTGDEKKHCMAEARDKYLAADFRCETLGSAKLRCLRYREQWSGAKTDSPKAAITHTEEPTMSPATPGDPSAAERNRDSTKQQQDAAGTLSEPTRQN